MQTLTFTPRESSKNLDSFRRESSFWAEHALIDLDTSKAVATARFYGAGSTVYCVLWVSAWQHGFPAAGETATCRGCGKAGGYGYHKPSAALQEAMQDAGFTLSSDIGGHGDSAMREAFEAMARLFGIVRPYLHNAHA